MKLTVRIVVPRLVSNSIGEPSACATSGQIYDKVECCRRLMMELEGVGGKVSGGETDTMQKRMSRTLIERSRWSGVDLINHNF